MSSDIERQRIQLFDTAVEATVMALSDPAVAQQLGGAAVSLVRSAENLFLPNIRDGVASLGRDVLETDRVALIPCIGDEVSAPPSLDYSMLAPTLRRFGQLRQSMIDRFGLSGQEAGHFLWQQVLG